MAEQGGIPLNWLIEVNSSGVREAFSLSKLHTIAITKYNPLLPVEQWSKFYDSDSVAKTFGFDSVEANFANNYFGVVNKKSSKADLLTIYNWNETATPATIKGSMLKDLNALKGINGNFNINIGGDTKQVSLDLATANSYTDCSNLLQEAIRRAGDPAPTTLEITAASNTDFTITKANGTATTNVLTINRDDYVVTDDGSGHVTYNRDTKTLTGVSAGTTIFTFKAQEANKNEVTIIVSVVCANASLNITPTITRFRSKLMLNINTNAPDYTFSSNNNNATFDKNTSSITGVTAGTTIFTFKAKNGSAAELSSNVTITTTTIASTPLLGVSETIQPTTNPRRAAVNPELPAFKNAEVIYSSLTGGLIVKSGIAGEDSVISFLQSPTSGNDISTSLGLSEVEGANIIKGVTILDTLDKVLSLLNEINGNYYVIDFTFKLDEAQAESLAIFVNNSNDRFLGVINSDDNLLTTNERALDNIKGYNGIIVNYYKNDKPLGFTSGLISSIDYAMENGNINLAFNDATKFSDIALNTKSEINTLEANNANSILKFGQMGQSQVWYGMGNILGIKTNNANVYIANSYLMFSLQYAFANLLHTQAFIGLRGTFNNGLMINVASDVFSRAMVSGIVVTGANLTDTERQVVISTFGSDSDTAIKQLQDVGYYIKIGNVDVTKQTLNLITAYVANKSLKRIIINNYILGA